MDLSFLKELLKNEPQYRLKQSKKAIFKDLIDNWDDATTLPIKLREKLNKKFPLLIKGNILESTVARYAPPQIKPRDDIQVSRDISYGGLCRDASYLLTDPSSDIANLKGKYRSEMGQPVKYE